MNTFNCIAFVLILALGSVACAQFKSEEKPENIISEDDYIHLMVELQLIRTHYTSQPDIVNLDSLKNLIYQKYNVDEEQFQISNQYYQERVKGQVRRTNKAIELMNIELQKFEEDTTERVLKDISEGSLPK